MTRGTRIVLSQNDHLWPKNDPIWTTFGPRMTIWTTFWTQNDHLWAAQALPGVPCPTLPGCTLPCYTALYYPALLYHPVYTPYTAVNEVSRP